MKTLQTRFGPVEYDPDQTIFFVQGMLGFEHLKHFVLVSAGENEFLFGLQSVEDTSVAFLLVEPGYYFPDYTCPLNAQQKALLGSDPEAELVVLCTITLHQDQSITLNLAAPVILDLKNKQAMQIVLEEGGYSSREPLPGHLTGSSS